MPGCDGKTLAKIRTGPPCGNDDKSGRSFFSEVVESIWYSGCAVDVVNDDVIYDANASRLFRVTKSSPLFNMSVKYVNRLLD